MEPGHFGSCRYSGVRDEYESFDRRRLTYDKIAYIGHGGNGKIILAEGAVPADEYDEWPEFEFSDVLLAVKDVIVCKADVPDLSHESFEFLRDLRHVNVLRCFGADLREFETRSPHMAPIIKLVTEYCHGGDLAIRMIRETLTAAQIKHFLRHAFAGLAYLHDKRVVHADIKCGNLFLRDHSTYSDLKIGDLDDPVRMSATNSVTADKFKFHRKGTRGHHSPEQLSMDGKVGRRTDVWSLGVAAVQMIRSKKSNLCFVNSDTQQRIEVMENTTAEQINVFVACGGIPEIPLETDSDLKELLIRCFERDPAQRATSAELLQLCDSNSFSHIREVTDWISIEFNRAPLTDLELRKATETGCYSQAPVYWLDNTTNLLKGDTQIQKKEALEQDLLTFVITEEHSLLYCMLLIQEADLRRALHIVVKGRRTLATNQFDPVQKYVIALTVIGQGDCFPDIYYLWLQNLEILSYESCSPIKMNGDISTFCKLRVLLFLNCVIEEIDIGGLVVMKQIEFVNVGFSPTAYNPLDGDAFEKSLRRMCYDDSFSGFRKLLVEKESITSCRAMGDLFEFQGTRSRAFSAQENFLTYVKRESLFTDGVLAPDVRRLLDGSSSELLVHGCCKASPLPESDPDSTAIQKITCNAADNEHAGQDLKIFCERLFELRQEDQTIRKPIAVLIKGRNKQVYSSFGRLAESVFQLTMQDWNSVTSRDVARFYLPKLQQLVFYRCMDVVLNCGDLDRFPDLRAIVLDECDAVVIEENVFESLERLDHISLDSPYEHVEYRTSEGRTHLKRFHFSPGYKWLRDYLKERPSLVETKTKRAVEFGDCWYPAFERTTDENFMVNLREEDLRP